MALPKGVKSQVDYTKLYMSNELDGQVLLEKKPELPKFTNDPNPSFRKVDPALTRKGKTPFMDYTGSKNTFKNFAKRGGISGFLNRRLSPEIKPTKFKKPLFSRAAASKVAKAGAFGKFAKGTVNVLSKMGPKGRLVAGGLLAGGALTAALLNRKKDKKSKVPVVPYQGTNVIERDPNSPDFGKVKQSTASPEIKSRNIKATSYYDKKDLSRSGPLAKSFYGPGGTGKKSFSLDNPNPTGFVTIKRDYLKPKVSTQTQGVYGKPYKFNGKTYKPPAYGSSVKEEALSKKQQKFFGIVRAVQKGEQVATTPEVAKAAKDMKKSDVKKFASTKHKGLPEKKKVDEVFLPEILDKKDVPHVKKLVKKLRDGSKTHAKQADNLEKAMNEQIKTGGTIKKPTVIMPDGKELPGLGGGGGGTNAITAKAKTKTFKNRVKDVGKILTFPISRRNVKPDPTEKFATEDTAIESELVIQDWNVDDIKFTEIETVDIIKPKPLKESMSNWREELDEGAGAALKVGSMVAKKAIPALMTGIGAAGTIMQSKKKETSDAEDEDRLFDLANEPFKNRDRESESPEVRKNRDRSEKRLKEFMAKRKKTRELTKNKQNLEKSYEKNMDNDIKDHYDWREELGEDWQKINRKDKTDGLSRKAVKAYRRENPGSKLQTAVTKDPKKLKKGSKSAKRRLSFCRRMKGMKKKLTSAKTRRDPDSRINKALRRWNC